MKNDAGQQIYAVINGTENGWNVDKGKFFIFLLLPVPCSP